MLFSCPVDCNRTWRQIGHHIDLRSRHEVERKRDRWRQSQRRPQRVQLPLNVGCASERYNGDAGADAVDNRWQKNRRLRKRFFVFSQIVLQFFFFFNIRWWRLIVLAPYACLRSDHAVAPSAAASGSETPGGWLEIREGKKRRRGRRRMGENISTGTLCLLRSTIFESIHKISRKFVLIS